MKNTDARVLACLALASAAVSGLGARSARANPSAELSKYLDQEITELNDAVEGCGSECQATSEAPEQWYFRRFFFRTQPRVTIGIPGVVTIDIVPEAELIWERPLPEGWTSYKPAS